MELQALKALIELHNHPELAKEPGHVYQVWQDGEVTLQKSGDLLWQRNLHMIDPGDMSKAVPLDLFPERSGKNAFIFTDNRGAYTVRHAILGYYRYKGESEETARNALRTDEMSGEELIKDINTVNRGHLSNM